MQLSRRYTPMNADDVNVRTTTQTDNAFRIPVSSAFACLPVAVNSGFYPRLSAFICGYSYLSVFYGFCKILMVFIGGFVSLSTVCAQGYPAKQIRILVGFAAGGASDVTARLLSPKLSESLGQPVIVENRAGSGGLIATDAVAKSPPDGYTLLLMPAADAVQPALRRKLPYDLDRDFAPVGRIVYRAMVRRRPPVRAGAQREGADRPRAREPRQAQLRLVRHRQLRPSRERAVQLDGEGEHRPRALQRDIRRRRRPLQAARST